MYATVTRTTFMGAYDFNGRSCLSDTLAKNEAYLFVYIASFVFSLLFLPKSCIARTLMLLQDYKLFGSVPNC